jgi:single-stranded-DNA-specific exonuclease
LTRWLITPPPDLTTDQLAAAGSPLLARLLVQRGITQPQAITHFLNPLDAPAVSGLELPGMEAALKRIAKALDEQEPILIYGDFDVDGITGTSVLMQTLTHVGAKVSYYIPDRALEGHGLHAASLMRLISSRQVKLVISTDTGITNYNEVCLLNNLGVSTIITDHHEVGEALPPSVANVNPQLLTDKQHPLAPLAGVGVAYKLCELLLAERNADPAFAESLLDLVAVGTIADVAPLTLENRRLVQQGIAVMNRRQRIGLAAILTQAGTPDDAELGAETVGFTLGPRLNAIGRLENANDAVKLLTTDDADEAKRLASHLEALNRRRKDVCDKTHREAEQFLRQSGVSIGPNPTDAKAIVLASPDWHLGVIGIVASRLVETYHVPVFLMVHDVQANTLRCSARSIRGFPIVEALEPLKPYFTVFGGHAMAGGFTLPFDKFNTFKQALLTVANQWVKPEMMVDELTVDATVPLADLDVPMIQQLAVLEPTGQANRAPIIGVLGATVSAVRLLNEAHLKLVLTEGKLANPVEAIYWRLGGRDAPKPGDTVDVAGMASINLFNGQERPQLMLKDFRLAKTPTHATVKPFLPQVPVTQMHATPVLQPLVALSAPLASAPSMPFMAPPAPSVDMLPLWVDHRHRDELAHFVGLLLQDSQPVRLVYHEGRDPAIPYLQPHQLISRERLLTQPLPAGAELLFWDLPPDGSTLAWVLGQWQGEPGVIHWMGGKYQAMPTTPSVSDFLKVLLFMVSRSAEAMPLRVLASRLSTSHVVILNGLALLQRLGYAQTELSPLPGAPQGEWLLHVTVLNNNGQPGVDTCPLEREALQEALHQVGKYRQFLLTATEGVLKPLIQARIKPLEPLSILTPV